MLFVCKEKAHKNNQNSNFQSLVNRKYLPFLLMCVTCENTNIYKRVANFSNGA